MSQRVAIISGGSGGIGKTIAKAYAKLGINVVLLARNEERLKEAVKEITAEGGISKYVTADVTNTYSLQNAVKEVYEMFGHIDILVNCAGGGPVGGILDISDEQWSENINIKQQGYVKLTRESIPYLIKSGGGHIINIIGVFGKQPHPDFIIGSMTNAALLAFTKAVSEEVAKFNIYVNAINPGATDTELWKNTLDEIALKSNVSAEMINKSISETSPLGRIANPEDIASVATFLISDNAKFITGSSINVDGGAYRGIA
ncbi:SDR family oxidoreductase [Clostridium sp.]|uniref:SDR family oxidoreductase n=1 Tax=Clostridium sp. TaxID=1506 RepID=UPI00262EAEA4|nr:SDR family oxidoreductase [Clostridium sp.]